MRTLALNFLLGLLFSSVCIPSNMWAQHSLSNPLAARLKVIATGLDSTIVA